MTTINKKYCYPEIEAITLPAKKLIVFLHGYGSSGNDLIGLTPLMQKKMPDCFFMAPHGIEPYELAPEGRQWFSLKDHTPSVLRDLVEKSSLKFQEIIIDKQNQLGLTNKDTVLIGFSQGTMLGLQSTLTQIDEPFAAMIGFSGLLIYPKECLNIKTPICLIHGEEDTVISISQMDLSKKYFDNHGIEYETLSIPELRHAINAEGIDKAIKFIQGNI